MSDVDLTKPITDERSAVRFMEEFVYSVSIQMDGTVRKVSMRLRFFFGEDTVEIPDIRGVDLISAAEQARLTYLEARKRQREVLVQRHNEIEMQILDLNRGLP